MKTNRRNGRVIHPEPNESFVETRDVKRIINRALAYMEADFPPLLSGPTGVGKTTLALHLAARADQPAVLLVGDESMDTADLVGKESGYYRKFVKDNYISSVLKKEERVSKRWKDHPLTTACKKGYTLIYDEYTRAQPETNNVLLSVLQEGVLVLPKGNGREKYVEVHPNFRAIFTSNPMEYEGVHPSQDALRDRMIELPIDYYDEETEVAITKAKSGLSKDDAQYIVSIVSDVRDTLEETDKFGGPSLRASIKIARVMEKMDIDLNDTEKFTTRAWDILRGRIPSDQRTRAREVLERRSYQRSGPKKEEDREMTANTMSDGD